ncbi:MAG: ABC transporter ATP-binding protein [Chloroflexi bacterium]|nr:ABC transporter ATP-binding protein [Chloroflexota bacterium]
MLDGTLGSRMANRENLYTINHLTVEYHTRLGILRAVDDLTFEIKRGEVLGLVGESGCGKSTLGKALMRMIEEPGKIVSGELNFDGIDIMQLPEAQMRELRGSRISMIFQDPLTSLNPVQKVVEHLTETIQAHESHVSDKAARARAAELVDRLGISSNRLDDYPHQLSGGMRQRTMISLALSLRADLVIADEATTSLDVIVEAQFLDLLRELRDEFDLTILLITHNIGIVAQLADRIAIMYAARLAEIGGIHNCFFAPKHPYSQGLLQSVPTIKLEELDLYQMAGSPPDLTHPPSGCRFHPRCPKVMDVCSQLTPTLKSIEPNWNVNCWLYEEIPEHLAADAKTP